MKFLVPEGHGIRLLSLDGGDARCISQLVILDELMNRLGHDHGRKVRPCEYFHSITGVGAGAVIAVLLGVLGLPIDEATEDFGLICDHTLSTEDFTDEERASRLVEATKRVLKRHDVPDTARLHEVDISAGCRVSICHSAAAIGGCRILRNYKSRHSSYNPTIVEAIRVAWATPGLFSSIRIGKPPVVEELISAVNGFNNPTLEAITEALKVYGTSQLVSSVLSIGSGKDTLFSDSENRAIRTAQETEITAENLQRRLGTLGLYFRYSVDHGVQDKFRKLEDYFGSITGHVREYLAGDVVSRSLDHFVKSSESTSYITIDTLYQSKAGGFRSSHGLPPLSAFFVSRIDVINQVTSALQRFRPGSPAMALVIGLSGTGKTQVCLKYAYDNIDRYDHILFVDASSTESIDKGLLARIGSIDSQLHPINAAAALDLLVNPKGNLTINWLMIMDNADDNKVDIRSYIPLCGHGSILITSRNASMSDLDPEGYIAMDVMSREEAVEALLAAAVGTIVASTTEESRMGNRALVRHTSRDRRNALEIVEMLGCLPLAVVQAACYIKKHKCLHNYAVLLKNSRSKILRWPASIQRDRLEYAHSVYAAFDTTLNALSSRALRLLGIISFVHFSDFPRDLIPIAASLAFGYDPYDLLDRPSEYQESIDLLQEVFCPGGRWDHTELDALLEELQRYSLVTLVPIATIVTLRFHPLLHSWANDRLLESERPPFQLAALRLLVCGTRHDDDHLWPYLSPQIELFSLTSDEIHVNDRAALAIMLEKNGHSERVFDVWKHIYSSVEAAHGASHLRTTRAALQLAHAYSVLGDWEQAERMERKILQIRRCDLGDDHLETACAMVNLAHTCKTQGQRYHEAKELELEVLRVRKASCEHDDRRIVYALNNLAETCCLQGHVREAQSLLAEVSGMMTSLLGRHQVENIRILEKLAGNYRKCGNSKEAIKLEKQITELWQSIRGDMHTSTLGAIARLARSYAEQGHHQESEKAWRHVADARRDMLGEQHKDWLDAAFWLGRSLYDQKQLAAAEALWRTVLAGWKELRKGEKQHILVTLLWLGRSVFDQKRFTDAEVLFKEAADGWRALEPVTPNGSYYASYWLGRALYEQKRPAESEVLWRMVLSSWKDTFGEEHHDTLSVSFWLGRAIHERDHFANAEAESLWRQAAICWQDTLGPFHYDTLAALFWLGRALYDRRQLVDAESILADVVAGWKKTLGSRSYEILDAQFWLSLTIYDQTRVAEAAKIMDQVVTGLQQTRDISDDNISNASFWLGTMNYDQRKFVDAETALEKAVVGWRSSLGSQHNDTLNALFWLSLSVYKQDRLKDAEVLLQELLMGWRMTFGPQHEDTLKTLYWLAQSIHKQGRYSEAVVLWNELVDGRRATLGEHDEATKLALDWLHDAQVALGKQPGRDSSCREESHLGQRPSDTTSVRGEEPGTSVHQGFNEETAHASKNTPSQGVNDSNRDLTPKTIGFWERQLNAFISGLSIVRTETPTSYKNSLLLFN